MRPFAGALVLAGLLALLAIGPGSARADDAEPTLPRPEIGRRVLHLLDYVAADYPAAVENGRIASELEYREQLEFTGQVRRGVERLGLAGEPGMGADLDALEAAIRGRRDASVVAARSRRVASRLRERLDLHAVPPRPPDLDRGRALYARACTSCHGPRGRGDGPAAAGLEPAPTDFTRRERALALSPFALYSSITYGIEGTAMAGFAERFSEAERFDLAFYVGSLGFSEELVDRGRRRVEAGAEDAPLPTLEALVEEPARELAAGERSLAAVAYLRTHPDALRRGELPLEIAAARLAASWEAYRAGERERAVDLAIAAYLDGVEHAESALDAVDADLRRQLERDFLAYREALRAGLEPAAAEPLYTALRGELAVAQERLGTEGLAAGAVFAAALAILAREGVEALLLVIALLGVVSRAGRPDARRYVHAGWVAAAAAGLATWALARTLIRISGAEREVVEGATALLAAAVLFYVSYWLISKVETARWQAFLERRIGRALSRGAVWTLSAVAFLAVYRELFETILFLEALRAQAGPGRAAALLGGLGAGAALLAAIAWAFFRLEVRLALRPFFAGSSVLLYLLAVVMAGQGVRALQEADWLPATFVPFVQIEWLGVHPTAEGLALQGLLLGVALGGGPWLLSERRSRRLHRRAGGAAEREG